MSGSIAFTLLISPSAHAAFFRTSSSSSSRARISGSTALISFISPSDLAALFRTFQSLSSRARISGCFSSFAFNSLASLSLSSSFALSSTISRIYRPSVSNRTVGLPSFLIYLFAPLFNASIATRSSPLPVKIIKGISFPLLLSSSRNSSPFIPGIL